MNRKMLVYIGFLAVVFGVVSYLTCGAAVTAHTQQADGLAVWFAAISVGSFIVCGACIGFTLSEIGTALARD